MSAKKLLHLVLGLLIAALVFVLYDRYAVTGTGYNAAAATTSLFTWVKVRWIVTTPFGHDFPYGWLAPLISLAMVVHLRHRLAAAKRSASWLGFGVILVALAMLWVAARTQQPRLASLSLVVMLWGIPFHLLGWPTARLLALPCAFLVFTLPFDLLEPVLNRLRVVVATLSTGLLSGLGVDTQRVDATTLRLALEPKTVIALSYEAGGVRSFMYVLAAAILLAWFRRRSFSHLALLAAATPVILVLANTGRTVLQAIGALAVGSRGEHLLGGAPTFYALALALLYGCHRLLDLDWRTRVRNLLRSPGVP